MEKLQKICAAAILTLALVLPVFAGDIGAPGAGEPPQYVVCVAGDADCHNAEPASAGEPTDITALDPITEAALSLLDSILSLF